MRVWRIFKAIHKASAFTGQGAHQYGGRWNSHGHAVVYASQSLSLAVLELLVHLKDFALLRRGYLCRLVEVDESLIEIWTAPLPSGWRKPNHPALPAIGDLWIGQARSAALLVPSAVVPAENNLLLNPNHPGFGQIKMLDEYTLEMDERLLEIR
jgi:RES domain-containing protein